MSHTPRQDLTPAPTRQLRFTATMMDTSSADSASISWPVDRPTERQPWTEADTERQLRGTAPPLQPLSRSNEPPSLSHIIPYEYLPHGRRSLSGIAIRSFIIGNLLGASLLLTINAIYTSSRFWRLPFFLSALSLFHFLEFYTTAYSNTSQATIASFLLTNGAQYRIAHSAAFVECLVTSLWFPSWQEKFAHTGLIAVGALLVLIGQTIRSIAMFQAGPSFNHQVQTKHAPTHVLVTSGIYGYLRHPAYFGFFWWGIGTQVVLGNAVCACLYAGVLWRFFSKRIRSEEKFLVGFFGEEYVKYRKSTGTGIPGI